MKGLFSSCGMWGLFFVAVHGFLIGVASVVVEHRLSTCGARVWLPCAMWDPPRPGIEFVSMHWQVGFLTTGPPGKS